MNERTIFLNVLELPSPESRAVYLDEVCAGDAGLRERVEALLKAHKLEQGLVDALAGSADERTSSMVPRDAGPPVEHFDEHEDLSFLGPCASSDCIGSLGPYEIMEILGRGGMGVVFKARDPKLQRIVAIKVLALEIAANKTAKKRFEREAQAAAAVSHDHIVTIHAVDEFRNLPYLVMECIVGRSLQQKIEETGPLELKEILRIGMQAALGLAAAHKQGLVHRDIKPANILLQNGIQRVKITDFGLARATDDVGMTHTGQIAGTPMYMSPEQAQGQKVDHLSDLFSLGSVLYTMCTGRPAFRAPNTVAVLRRVCDDAARPILEVNSELPQWLVAIVNKLMSKKKEDRYQTAAEVAELLSDHLSRLQEPRSGQTVVPSIPSVLSMSHAAVGSSPPVVPSRAVRSTGRRHTWPLAAAGMFALIILAAAGTVALVMLGAIIVTTMGGTNANINVPSEATVETSASSSLESETHAEPALAPFGSGKPDVGWHGWPADAPPPAIAPFDAEQARQHQAAWARYLNVPVEHTNTIGMKFRLVPPGEFLMGSTQEQINAALPIAGDDQLWQDCIRSEGPQHKVILTQPTYLCVTEITQSQYMQVMMTNPSYYAASGKWSEYVAGIETSAFPVEGVSWTNATEFCGRLSALERLESRVNSNRSLLIPFGETAYRLPTEAEWEFACRAGAESQYYPGNTSKELSRAAWFLDTSDKKTHAVGERQGNSFGFYDMHGNVWEWTLDAWSPTCYSTLPSGPVVNPINRPLAGSERMTRGGNYSSNAYSCRSASRCSEASGYSATLIGFRAALSVDAVCQALNVTRPAIPRSPTMTPSAHRSDTEKLPTNDSNRLGMEYVNVPKGTGWLSGGDGKVGDTVFAVEGDFYLGKYTVTQGQWEQVMGNNPSHFSRTGPRLDAVRDIPESDLKRFPVEFVSWDDAELFLKKLNELDPQPGWTYRLPTEAEWEYACRGGPVSRTQSAFDFYLETPSNELLAGQANFGHGNAGRTLVCGSYKPNSLGLHDMHGNVHVWCSDRIPSPDNSQIDSHRVLRGGSYWSESSFCRASTRFSHEPSYRSSNVGLRVARVPVNATLQNSTTTVSSPSTTAPLPTSPESTANIDGFSYPINGNEPMRWRFARSSGWNRGPERNGTWRTGTATFDPTQPAQLVFDRKGNELTCERITNDIYTEKKYGDVRIELEFMIPKGSNSGIFLMGEYEINIVDFDMSGHIIHGPPPQVVARKPAGTWQSFDITFHAPRFDGDGKKIGNASIVKALYNGELIHENVTLPGPTHDPSMLTGKETPTGPLLLQGSTGPVAFRKIRITPLN
ncbi:MAG: SUMF1/EgtB/PvdO family nonheme iron enzyme [Planctomycetes bacterium]|nr:SUMF1/EgtB/PvdO family nonheme iron enzyme [Planctomycetota bacterium]